MGVPKEFILELKRYFDIKCFVEAGTFRGHTTLWAAEYFEKVVTIENSHSLYEQVVAKHGTIDNICFLYGHTVDMLNEVIQKTRNPSIFWLDSHWCGGESYGEFDQCPLLVEIDIINQIKDEHFILIDDARLFLSPPPFPNNIEQWPSIDKVIQALTSSKNERYIVVFEDVIIAVPEYARNIVASWCQRDNTIAWNQQRQQIAKGRKRTFSKKVWAFVGVLSSKLKSSILGGNR